MAFATDPAIQGGAMGRDGCARIVHAIESAVRLGCPVIGLWHSGGARLRECNPTGFRTDLKTFYALFTEVSY